MKLSRGFGDAFRRIAAPVQKLFGGLFGKRRRGRAGLWQDDLMYPPDIRSVDDIRNNPLVGPKVKFLERYHPILLARMGLSLTAASRNFTDSRDMLESLRKKREEKQSNIAKIAREQPLPSEIFLNEQDRPEREAPSEKGILEIVLAISNAFILTLGLLDFVGVSIRHVRTDQAPVLFLVVTAAGSLTLIIKRAVYKQALFDYRHEPPRSHDDETGTFRRKIGWWKRTRDGSLWYAAIGIVLETCFGAPAIVQMLSADIREQWIWQVCTLCGAALAAFSNVGYGWSSGMAEGQYLRTLDLWDQKTRAKLEEIRNSPAELEARTSNAEIREIRGAAEACLKDVQREIEVQRHVCEDAFERARLEWQRFERDCDKLWERMQHKVHQSREDYERVAQDEFGPFL